MTADLPNSAVELMLPVGATWISSAKTYHRVFPLVRPIRWPPQPLVGVRRRAEGPRAGGNAIAIKLGNVRSVRRLGKGSIFRMYRKRRIYGLFSAEKE